ncbi:hypothetical protein CEXT_291261 [Caerostris extrusa]|uniref:LAGLIDADG homing endonuclease n=1 Tax=Caerostris extrusa TaxID=172846 RepID=A0AAV4S885_CAEEX|nr:hypothetical protein CEXT_291261 [Caerostris extrusa]
MSTVNKLLNECVKSTSHKDINCHRLLGRIKISVIMCYSEKTGEVRARKMTRRLTNQEHVVFTQSVFCYHNYLNLTPIQRRSLKQALGTILSLESHKDVNKSLFTLRGTTQNHLQKDPESRTPSATCRKCHDCCLTRGSFRRNQETELTHFRQKGEREDTAVHLAQ